MPDIYESTLDELDGLLEEMDGLGAGEDYRESVAEKCQSMRSWYEDHGSLTDGQMTALDNMIEGAKRWLRDE